MRGGARGGPARAGPRLHEQGTAGARHRRADARAGARCRPRRAQTLLGDIYARRGLHGEALERYREARESNPGDRSAALGELRGLVALDRAAEATFSPNSCWRRSPATSRC